MTASLLRATVESTVHGIVRDHGGTINVYSEPGIGTTFHVFFPCIESEAGQESQKPEPLVGGTERVLFVDDEKVLADIGEQMLQRLGAEKMQETGINGFLRKPINMSDLSKKYATCWTTAEGVGHYAVRQTNR